MSLLDDKAKLVTSRLGATRFRVAGTAEFNGYNPRYPRCAHRAADRVVPRAFPRHEHPPERALGRPQAHDAGP